LLYIFVFTLSKKRDAPLLLLNHFKQIIMTLKQISITALLALLAFGYSASANKGFTENIGQFTDQYQQKRTDVIAKYNAGNGLNIFLSQTGIHYQWSAENELYRMDVKPLGANPHSRISKENATGFREQYQLANVKGTAESFEKITYHDIYPGIDWLFYFNEQGKLEHDFIIRPGAKVSDIRLQYAGAENLKVDRQGNLVATTKYGSISEPKPYSYELATNSRISSSYHLQGDILTFKTGAFKGTLVIDPVISWATYIGGSEYDEIRDVKIGNDGFVYAVGATNSTTNIATTGAHLTTFQGGNNSIGSDAFITKFDTDGNCIWATYYGGTNVDLGLSLAVDTAGYLYMAGRTNSQTGISTTGSHQAIKAGTSSGYDAFLIKFDTFGIPVWGTYYGGTGADGQQAVVVTADRYNNLYLAGNTQSANGIATTGTFQSTRPGSEDGFIAKFNTSGSLIWGTYLGTSAIDWINGIAVDTSGDIVVIGQTVSTTGLSTSNAYLTTGNGGTDGFVAKFNSAGQRIWGTYYGGSDFERLYAVTTDSSNAIYFGGITYSTTGIATSSAHQLALGSAMDACIGKLDPNGTMEWSTYYGGSENEAVAGLTFFNGKLFVTGTTVSPNNIATPDGIVSTFNNSASEGMLVTFSTSGIRLWGTYFGGDLTEDPGAIAINNMEQVFIGGKTASVNGFSTIGAYQTTFEGNQDGMLMRINMCNVPQTPTLISGNTTVCEHSEQQYTIPAVVGADSYIWILPAGWIGISSNDTINIVIGANGGTIKVAALNACGASDTISLAVTLNPAPQATISRNGNILSVTQTFASYQWLLNSDPIPGATNPTHIISQNGIYALQVEGSNGCKGISNEILVDNMTSISEGLAKLGVKLYPNPFSTELHIYSPIQLNAVLVDVSGRVVKNDLSIKEDTKLDLSSLPVGNYYLNLYSPETKEYLGTAVLVKVAQ